MDILLDISHYSNKEDNNIKFTNTEVWKDLKEYHKQFHMGMQEYINENASLKPNAHLRDIAFNIEQNTQKVFDLLDKVKIEYCNK